MSTYYEQTMQALGTNIISTNANFQAAIRLESDSLDAMATAERQTEINSFLWHAGVLIAVALCAFFLWRIVRLKQKESTNNRQASGAKSTSPGSPDHELAGRRPITTKPPLLDSQLHILQPQLHEKVVGGSHDLQSHPDSRYMPKS